MYSPHNALTPLKNSHHWLHSLHLDLQLILGLLLLASVGIISLYSASGQNIDLMVRQGVRLLIGFGGLLIIAQIPPQQIKYWSPWLFLGSMTLLVLVAWVGTIVKGAQRWLDIGFVSLQPAEFMKIVLPMMIAWYLDDKRLPPPSKVILFTACLVLIPMLFIIKQPDLGTALLVGASGSLALFLAGLSWRLIGALALLAAISAPLLWSMLHDYQRQRVLTFLNPESDPLGTGYHIIQSTIAIGSGGIDGKGWLNGTQSHLDFIPERSTDFIFAVFGEEFGFVGILTLIGIYLWITLRGLTIATLAQDTFSRILAGTLSLMFFMYMFINMGMVIGILPIVGVPLPLISYSGTASITLLLGFGIIMSIHTHRRFLSP